MKAKKFKYKLIFLLATIILIASCTEDITNEIKLDNTYVRLVVDGNFTTDTTAQKVILSKSGSAVGGDSINYVSNAIVSITDGTTLFPLTLTKKGTYETKPDVYGIPGRTYTLNITVDLNNDGVMEQYTASSLLRGENPIDSIHVVMENNNRNKSWIINLFGLDNGQSRNYYLMKALKNHIMLTDSAYEYDQIGNNIGFEGKYYMGFAVYRLSYDKPDERLVPGDTVTLEMDGITEDYANYLIAFITEYYPKIPMFSGPSANIPTNVYPQDNAVGFFAAYSISRKSVIYK